MDEGRDNGGQSQAGERGQRPREGERLALYPVQPGLERHAAVVHEQAVVDVPELLLDSVEPLVLGAGRAQGVTPVQNPFVNTGVWPGPGVPV